jgi:hypothetical protein
MTSILNTILIFPFEIRESENKYSPYDLDIFSDPFENKDKTVQELIAKLASISFNKTHKIDSQYHDHIKNMIANDINPSSINYLKIFEIPEEYYFKNSKNINYQKFDLFIDDSLKLNKPFSKTKFIINDSAGLGYLILNFGIEDVSGNEIIASISKVDFFRYYLPTDVTGKSKYSLYVKSKTNNNTTSETQEPLTISLYEIIDTYISRISSQIRFLYRRPILFHIISSEKELQTKDIVLHMYKALRIPPQKESITSNNYTDYIKVKNPDPLIKILTMNEGAFVVDCTHADNNYITNKYFTSFILALNQREILLLMNKAISFLNLLDSNEKDRLILISKLQIMKNKINVFQLKQLIFSVSLNNEIGLFFNDLQQKFNIEILLRDNKDSVIEIHDLLSNQQIINEKEKEDQRNRNNNIIIGILTCIQTSSAFATIFGESRISVMVIFIIMLLSSVLMIYFLWVRKKVNR